MPRPSLPDDIPLIPSAGYPKIRPGAGDRVCAARLASQPPQPATRRSGRDEENHGAFPARRAHHIDRWRPASCPGLGAAGCDEWRGPLLRPGHHHRVRSVGCTPPRGCHRHDHRIHGALPASRRPGRGVRAGGLLPHGRQPGPAGGVDVGGPVHHRGLRRERTGRPGRNRGGQPDGSRIHARMAVQRDLHPDGDRTAPLAHLPAGCRDCRHRHGSHHPDPDAIRWTDLRGHHRCHGHAGRGPGGAQRRRTRWWLRRWRRCPPEVATRPAESRSQFARRFRSARPAGIRGRCRRRTG